jgi:hypothetical protein
MFWIGFRDAEGERRRMTEPKVDPGVPGPPIPARYRDSQDWLNQAVLYALKEGCFSPVPEPHPNASARDLVQWGAMRNLHDAIAAHFRAGR